MSCFERTANTVIQVQKLIPKHNVLCMKYIDNTYITIAYFQMYNFSAQFIKNKKSKIKRSIVNQSPFLKLHIIDFL